MTDRRQQILAAAVDLMHAEGLKAVTVRAVATRVGIGASTLRHYFPSQADLHEAMVRHTVRSHVGDRSIHDREIPARDRLSECLLQFLPTNEAEIHQAAQSWQVLLERAGEAEDAERAATVSRWIADEGTGAIENWLRILRAEGVALRDSVEEVAAVLGTYADGLLAALIFDRRFTLELARTRLRRMVEVWIET